MLITLATKKYSKRDFGYAIADRVKKIDRPKTDTNSIDTIIRYVKSNAYRTVAMDIKNVTNACKPHVDKWLNQIYSFENNSLFGQIYTKFAAYDLLSPKRFKPHFGKTFNELSSQDIGDLHYQLHQGCLNKYTKNIRDLTTPKILNYIPRIIQNFQGHYRGDFLIYPFARNVLENWRAYAIQLISESNDNISIIQQASQNTLTLLWSSHPSFSKEISLARNKRTSIAMLNKLNSMINTIDNRFLSFDKLARFLEPYKRDGITSAAREKATTPSASD